MGRCIANGQPCRPRGGPHWRLPGDHLTRPRGIVVTHSLMVSSVDQSILWISDGFADHLGAGDDSLTGSSVFELLEGSQVALWHSLFMGIESIDERFDDLRVHRVGEPSSVPDYQVRGVRYLDAGHEVMVTLRPSGSGLVHPDAEMLAEVEQRYDALLRGSFDAVIIHDGESVLFMNAVAAKLFGVDVADFAGTPVT